MSIESVIENESSVSRESFARQFRPAGFKEPGYKPRNYKGAGESELGKMFYSWLKQLPRDPWNEKEQCYQSALKSISNSKGIMPEEANSLLIGFEPREKKENYAGLFVSACYTKSREKIIVFDVKAPYIEFIGYKLPEDFVLINNYETGFGFAYHSLGLSINNNKTGDNFASRSSGLSINNGKTGDFFASFTSGISVNNGETGDCFAYNSSGILINNGKTGWGFGWSSSALLTNNGKAGDEFADESSGFVIITKEPKRYGRLGRAKKVLMPKECERIPELQKYINSLRNLKATDEASARELLEQLGENPMQKIRQDILNILANK